MSSNEAKNAYAREYHKKRMQDPEYVKKRREQAKVNQAKFRQTKGWQKQVWGSNKSSKIYFIQAKSGPIKIGLTKKRAETRLAELQTANYEPLVLLKTIPGDIQTEFDLHQKFQHLLIPGEWFRPEPELLSFITTAL